MLKTMSGRQLNQELGIEAKHALAHKDGTWYGYLERFPGVLFDSNGYVLFQSNKEYLNCQHIVFGEKVHIPKGISNIVGYTTMPKKKGKHFDNHTSSHKTRAGNRS